MRRFAGYWIKALQLEPHIEGGYYHRSYCSDLELRDLPPVFRGARPASTAIYFLLEHPQFSAMHRIASDELWHFYDGDPLLICEINTQGDLILHRLGSNPANHESFQCLIKGGSWFGAMLQPGGAYTLAGCTVAPGFDFDDFELGSREALLQSYPGHQAVITALTRS